MKKIIVFLIAVLPLLVVGQSALESVFEKYSGKDGFTIVNIGPEMFRFLAAADIEVAENQKEVDDAMEAVEKLTGLKILTCENASSDMCMRFRKDIQKNLPSNFLELMTVKDGDSDIKFLANQNKDGTISEFLMLVTDTEDVVIMSFTGVIDMNTISKIGKTMQIEGMEKLEENQEPAQPEK